MYVYMWECWRIRRNHSGHLIYVSQELNDTKSPAGWIDKFIGPDSNVQEAI
jgi:hypothetical protein